MKVSEKCESVSCSVVSNSMTPWTLACQAPLSMEFSRQNTGVCSCSLLWGVILTQGSISGLPHCRQILYHLNHQGRLISSHQKLLELGREYEDPRSLPGENKFNPMWLGVSQVKKVVEKRTSGLYVELTSRVCLFFSFVALEENIALELHLMEMILSSSHPSPQLCPWE